MPYEPWMLAAIDHAGYNGIGQAHIEAVADQILSSGITQVSRADFDSACRRCGIDPNNFSQSDLDRLEQRLNRH